METKAVCNQDNLLTRSLRMLQAIRQSDWPKTKADTEVPLIFRENYLLSGYRVPHRSWGYYWSSLFFVHNESGNVWSHLVALLIFTYKVFELGPQLGNWSEPMSWPILGFLAGIITYALLSTTAHMFQSKSPLVHYLCFQIDYIGIGMNGYGTGCLVYYSTGSEAYYRVFPPALFMSLNVVMAVLVCFCCSMAKLRYSRPYPAQRKLWQLGSVGLHCLFGGLPYVCLLWECVFYDEQCTFAEHWSEFRVVMFLGLSTFFYATALPERLSPGTFDIVGHGHQIFHVFMMVTSLLQIEGGLNRMRNRSLGLAAMATPDVLLIFGGIAVVILVDTVFILYTHKYRVNKVKTDKRREYKLQTNGASFSNGYANAK